MEERIIERVLMCRPDHPQVEYKINPAMKPGSINPQAALIQWKKLVETYQKLGIEVEIINQVHGLPDMVFCTDHGLVKDKTVVLGNFRWPERRRESEVYAKWYEENEFNTENLPNQCFFEGGDYQSVREALLIVGTGFRTSLWAAKELSHRLNTEMIPLILTNPWHYHLDMSLLPVNPSTAFCYPKAFSDNSLDRLRKIIPNLLILSDEEASRYAANSLVTDHHVIMQKGIPTFRKKVADLGYIPVEVDVSEFRKAGGGIHCLTKVIKES